MSHPLLKTTHLAAASLWNPMKGRSILQLLHSGSQGMKEQAAQSAVQGDAAGLALALAAGSDESILETGDPVLLLAIRARRLDCVQLLIRHGTDLQATSAGGSTALLTAIEVGDLPITKLLLEAGASVVACNDAVLGPLQAACLKSGCHLLGALLESLAAYPDKVKAGDEVLAAVFAAVSCSSPACLAPLLGFAPVTQRYRHHAGLVASGRVGDEQAMLLRDRQRVLLSPGGRNESQLRALCFLAQTASLPCHMAAALGQTQCLELLLCSDPFAAGDINLEGWTPLLFAASAGHVDCLRLLVSHGAELEHANRQDRTALFLAAISGQPKALAVLIQKGAKMDAQESSRLYTPLMAAASRASMLEGTGDAEEAEAFLQCVALLVASGAGLDIPSKDGSTPLHAAAEHGAATCMALLLKGGAAINTQDGQGRSPIALAAAKGHTTCVLRLLGRGASVSPGLAGNVLKALSKEPMSLWEVLGLLGARQLQALSSSPDFYSLPVPEGPPPAKLPPSLLAALLEVACEDMTNLMYNVVQIGQSHLGRRPSYLLELVAKGWPGSQDLQSSLSTNRHLVQAVQLWGSLPPLLQYAACISRCANVPAGDKERLAGRVGHLLSAYHQLATLCCHAGLAFTWAPHPYHGLPRLPLLPDCSFEAADSGEGRTAAQPSKTGAMPMDEKEKQGSVDLQQAHSVGKADDVMDQHQSVSCPDVKAAANASDTASGPRHREPAILTLLVPYSEALQRLVQQAGQGAALAAWHFLLDYPQAASLPTKQTLLQSMITSWQRRREDQLSVTSSRQSVLQSVCTAVDESTHGGMEHPGTALWHGVKVAFAGENGAGDGVRREWFTLLAAELTNPGAGLFETHNEGQTYQPAPHAHAHCDEGTGKGHLHKFELVGSMLGVALMQGCTVPGFSLSPHVWKLLLGRPELVDLAADLAEADPQLARGLAGLRLLGGGVEDLGLHFQTHDALGNTVDLVPGGSDLAVTAANLEQYIGAVEQYKLVGSTQQEVAAMRHGMRSVVTGAVLDRMAWCLVPEELNTLVAGQHDLNPQEWRAHSAYTNCCAATPLVAWFWEVVNELPQPQLASLLGFVTGSTTLPAGGFAALRGFNGAPHPFTLALVASDGDGRLPRASTCFNMLYLPAYSSAEMLRQRLLTAILSSHIFDEGAITR